MRFALHPEMPAAKRPAAEAGQSQEVKSQRFSSPVLCSRLDQRAKFQDPVFLNCHFKTAEPGKSSAQLRPKPFRLDLVLQADHKIVGMTDKAKEVWNLGRALAKKGIQIVAEREESVSACIK